MIIEFKNITKYEKNLLIQLEQAYPESIVLTDIIAGFDGETATQLIIHLGPALIAGITAIIVAILSRKKEDTASTSITIIFNDGNKHTLETPEEFENFTKHE